MRTRKTGKRTVFAKGQLLEEGNTITLFFGDLLPISFQRDGVGSENFTRALRMIEKADTEPKQSD